MRTLYLLTFMGEKNELNFTLGFICGDYCLTLLTLHNKIEQPKKDVLSDYFLI